MKFGIFVFGDNHPDSGLSVSDYYRTGGMPMGNIRTTMEFLSKEIMPQFEAKR